MGEEQGGQRRGEDAEPAGGEQGPAADRDGTGERARDEARPHGPSGDETAQPGPVAPGPSDETRRHRPLDETQRHGAFDETQRHGAFDETQRHGAHDGTQPHGAFDETQRYAAYSGADEPTDPEATRVVNGPPARETAATAPIAGGWAARAPIPRPGGEPMVERREWIEQQEPAPGRRWWIPAVVALVALLLLAVLGYGLWLLLGEGGNKPSPPAAPTATAPPPPTLPETTQPQPQVPTAPTATTPAGVVVPRLVGLSEADARATLDDVGLTFRLAFEENGGFPPGSVVRTDPPAGTMLPRGDEVTLIIATPPRTVEPTVTTEPPTTAPPTPTATG
ncbi:PASTA domain-containing protein [Rhizomonospora bruguierae]|uniref:PASTA domain-containing protein n=1 Tax=Rhizomonospora bruguierae TaxID=1581705 RepID=UPI001BCD52EE|nr:PASTA domain-containing protein [Micromonospora sp. NBRC 107566]